LPKCLLMITAKIQISMSTFFNTRTLKISSIFAKAQFKKSLKPKITISGDWVKRAGFEIGERIKVEVFENRLIITKDEN
jgi:toxic protein SymE